MRRKINNFAENKKPSIEALTNQIVTLQNNIEYTSYLSAINSMPNPDVILKKSGNILKDAIDLVDSDDRVFSCIQNRLGQLSNMEYTINCDDKKSLDLCQEIYSKLDHSKILKMFFKAIVYGYAPIEIIWELDKYLIPKKLNIWPNHYFKFDNFGKLAYMEMYQTNLIYPDEYKILCIQNNPSEINPFGESLFVKLYWLCFFRKETMKLKVDSLEKYGKPIPVAEHMFNDDYDKIKALLNQIKSLRNGSPCAIPEGVKLTNFMGNGSADHSAFSSFLDYLDNCISIVILGGNLTTMVESGSLAAASSQKENQYNIAVNDANLICDYVNKLFRWIVDLNFGEGVESPIITMRFKDEADLAQVKMTQDLCSTQNIKFTKEYYMKYFNLQENEFEIMASLPVNNNAINFAEGIKKDTFDMIDDSLSNMSNEDLESLAEGLYKPVVDFIKRGKSLEQMQKEIHTLFPEMNSNKLMRIVERAGIICEQLGRNSVLNDINK